METTGLVETARPSDHIQSGEGFIPAPWYAKCYARILIDNHITEDDPSFMTKFDPSGYVAMVKKAGVDSAMVYACCHNGNCYYPTKVGHMHAGLAGRDVFGEVIGLLREEGIVPVAYCTVVFHNHSAKDNPDWRWENHGGVQHNGRYWLCCPNNADYRRFAKAQISEILSYNVDGIFIDMTFWPGVCACHNCRERYRRETGAEIPSVIGWGNSEWVRFQRSRERWLGEFAQELSSHVKDVKPLVTVNHQFSPVLHGWSLGQSPAIAEACDYIGGDFYGGKYQQAMGTKVLAAFTDNLPFEFHTSRCVNLHDHTSMKSEHEMVCSAATTLANGGAYFFIDAINTDGTLEDDVYELLGAVSRALSPFKMKVQALRPALLADVGLYFSMPSHIDERDNGLSLLNAEAISNMTPATNLSPLEELLGTSIILSKANMPYRVVVYNKLDLVGIKTLIINDASFMSEEEVERLRAFVHDGGTLIATGDTSLYNLRGETSGDFQLSDVFGVSYSGKRTSRVSYLAFDGGGGSLPGAMKRSTPEFLLSNVPSPLVTATTAKVLAGVCETQFDPDDAEHYSSIHSNPPGPTTGFHGMTVSHYGSGKCIYLYSPVLAMRNWAHQKFGLGLFGEYAKSDILPECDAPACVETTVLRSSTENAYLLCFVNQQLELPNLPVFNISTSLRLPAGVRPSSCRFVSSGEEIGFEFDDGVTTVVLPHLDTVEMIEFRTE